MYPQTPIVTFNTMKIYSCSAPFAKKSGNLKYGENMHEIEPATKSTRNGKWDLALKMQFFRTSMV